MATTGKDLDGQVAIVTGGAGGIGGATARLLAEQGARVVILDNDDQRGRAAAEALRDLGSEASFHRCDVTRRADVEAAVHATLAQHGQIDVLANVVGGTTMVTFWEMTEDDWDRVVDFNLKSQFLCSRAVVPHMIERHQGAIVNVSSGRGATPAPGHAPYSAAKAGVIGLTRTMAAELAPHGIRVNAVAPGITLTARSRSHYPDEAWARLMASQPLGRASEPEDIAEAIAFLASPRSRNITGQVLFVNGGSFMP
jgi:NAD(P)-dependent dehydrogenase (short-subunit alcohol dehydrogenase family)